jgi:hypothetical protein
MNPGSAADRDEGQAHEPEDSPNSVKAGIGEVVLLHPFGDDRTAGALRAAAWAGMGTAWFPRIAASAGFVYHSALSSLAGISQDRKCERRRLL